MKATVLFARIVLLLVLGIMLFFSYYILRAAVSPKADGFNSVIHSPPQAYSRIQQHIQQQQAPPQPQQFQPLAPRPLPEPPVELAPSLPPPPHTQPEAPYIAPEESNPVPNVAGQTTDDLRAPEPLQESPPSVQYNPPEATDPMNRNVHMSATFGSNLRHPEQMIEKRPRRSMKNATESGIATLQTRNTDFPTNQYSAEMIQNGGLMADGLMANDTMDTGGLAYSML